MSYEDKKIKDYVESQIKTDKYYKENKSMADEKFFYMQNEENARARLVRIDLHNLYNIMFVTTENGQEYGRIIPICYESRLDKFLDLNSNVYYDAKISGPSHRMDYTELKKFYGLNKDTKIFELGKSARLDQKQVVFINTVSKIDRKNTTLDIDGIITDIKQNNLSKSQIRMINAVRENAFNKDFVKKQDKGESVKSSDIEQRGAGLTF